MISSFIDPSISATTYDPSYISNHCFNNDKEILESLLAPEYPWDDMHHHSFFIPEEPSLTSDRFLVEAKDFIHDQLDWFKNPIPTPETFEEGNMANISPTIKVNISTNPKVVEYITLGASCSPEEVTSYKELFQEFHDFFAWSYTEIPGLDPSIFKHRIDTWPNVEPIHQKQRPIHPSKVTAVKAEIKKLCTTGFI